MPPCWPQPKKNERTRPVPHRMKEKEGSAVDAIEWSTSVYAAAVILGALLLRSRRQVRTLLEEKEEVEDDHEETEEPR